MKRILSLFLALTLSLSLLSVTASAADDPAFSDIPPTTWYAFAAQDTAERGLMNGVAPGVFQGEATLTRAMTVTVLWRPLYRRAPRCLVHPGRGLGRPDRRSQRRHPHHLRP